MASSSPSPLARLSLERRPKLLKEFLLQDDPYSCSPNDFGSYPKKLCKSTLSTQNFHGSTIIRSNKGSSQLLRSRSSRAATATISAINKVINIVKFLPFASVKSPSIFPRSISRKLSRRTNYKKSKKHSKNNVDQDVSVTVKVKDILRWKSFRDLAEEKSTPLDSSFSPYRCAITTSSTTTTTSSKRTSWCDSDFTAEDLPSWWGENGEFLGELLEDGINKVGRKNILEESTVGGYCMRTTKSINKEELCFDENEQHSPVSILESPFQEDDEEGMMAFSFHKRKSILMQRIQQFESLAEENTSSSKGEELKEDEEIEEKAKELLINLKEMEDCEANYMDDDDDQLLLDFFWNELITSGKHQNNVDEKLMREAKSWINGDYNGEFEWEIEDKREAYIKDMERIANWSKFEEEKQELILDLEFVVFNELVHEVLEDVFCHK